MQNTEDTDLNVEQVVDILKRQMTTSYNIEISPPQGWVLPNRAKFPSWLTTTFKYPPTKANIDEIAKRCPDNEPCHFEIKHVNLFPYQKIIKDYIQFDSPYRGLLLFHNVGSGKCLGLGTKVLKYDGSVIAVQDIVIGDKLMGDDSTCRNVLSLARGNDAMYEVIPEYGEPYTVNSEHVLTLVDPNGKIVDIAMNEYIKLTEEEREKFKGIRNKVEFKNKPLDIDPYAVSLDLVPWDIKVNSSSVRLEFLAGVIDSCGENLSQLTYKITHKSKEFLLDIIYIAKSLGMTVSDIEEVTGAMKPKSVAIEAPPKRTRKTAATATAATPRKRTTKKESASGAAAAVAANATATANATANATSNATSNATAAATYSITILKGGDQIPVRKVEKVSRIEKEESGQLLTTIKVIPKGRNNYFGFTLDGNNRFLLGDFTVTHNSASSIASAEMLMNHMDVVMMLPASLENNYVNEIKKYGKDFYRMEQFWKFIPLSIIKPKLTQICNTLSLKKTFIEKQKGLWLPVPGMKPNFRKLPEKSQKEVSDQINEVIQKKFTFVHYNGLNRNKLAKMFTQDSNFFDNKCIIVDEVHNFIRNKVNKAKITSTLYKYLMEAKNAKLILLSGTPIINKPYEISVLINLLTGKRIQAEMLFLKKNANIQVDKIEKILNENMYVDYYNFNPVTRKLIVNFLPEHFVFNSKGQLKLKRDKDESISTNESRMSMIEEQLKNEGYSLGVSRLKYTTTLPESEDEFKTMFISNETVINKTIFMKRILGTLSFYSKLDPSLYPTSKLHEVKVELSDHQFKAYEESRRKERTKEKSKKKNRSDNSNDDDQVYKFYSRANCNFVFPTEVKRPLPSDLKKIRLLDEIDDESKVDTEEVQVTLSEKKDYNQKINEALKQLSKGKYLDIDNIGTYSAKMRKIVKYITSHDRIKNLVYSQFRKVEGLGILSLALEKAGFAQMRLKKVHEEWDVDISDEDMFKKKYMVFTGSNDETRILLDIFNSNFASLPPLVKDKIKLMVGDKYNDKNNFGDVINTIMITESGAEGISLKHVRAVHIMEPYWNYVRIDQVIGRAIRTGSHVDLKEQKLRHVDIFLYYGALSKEQLESSLTIQRLDKGVTSDEEILSVAKKKKFINEEFLTMLRKASIDCALNSDINKGLKCFSFPVNIKDDSLILTDDIQEEIQDEDNIITNAFEATVYITKKGNFLVKKDTMEVYDYDIYRDVQQLVKIGRIVPTDNNIRRIKIITS